MARCWIFTKVRGFRCERCDHKWVPRRPRDPHYAKVQRGKLPAPRICPSCKSAWWDEPKPRGA